MLFYDRRWFDRMVSKLISCTCMPVGNGTFQETALETLTELLQNSSMQVCFCACCCVGAPTLRLEK